MKIYNEIIIDMNTGETIYEDSFEYKGDVDLCCGPDLGSMPSEEELQKLAEEQGFDSWAEYQASLRQQPPSPLETTNASQATAMPLQTQATDIQSNPLPSIPTISNVGSIPFTGTVSNIAGGFQPLPQVAGGKKKLYQLSKFHGGINQKSSPRDIADFECQEAQNVTFSKIGRISLLGDCLNENAIGADIAADSITHPFPGYGLFQFKAPADHDGAVTGEHIFTCTSNGDEVDIYNTPNTDGIQAGWINFAGDDNVSNAHVYYSAGNGLYVADSNFANTNNSSKAKIYVYREEAGSLNSNGWKEGKPLIDSPTYDSDAHGDMAAGTVKCVATHADTEHLATVASTLIAECDPNGTGTWGAGGATTYYFYISWLFDGGTETGLTSFAEDSGNNNQASDGIAFTDNKLELNISLKHIPHASNNTELGADKRIEGGRIYFKESGTAERWLLAEFNLIDGVQGALDSTFMPWTVASNVFSHTTIIFENPPEIYSYISKNGYFASETYTESKDEIASEIAGPVAHDIRYKTAVVGSGGIVYIGNVKFRGKLMPDMMMHSMPNKPGVFPGGGDNSFDSPSSDSSSITALAAYRDTILQFKENSMHVVNISNGPTKFYVQSSFRNCGVFNPCQVFTASFGVIFANKNGCYIYDGQKVMSLTDGKFDWSSQSGVSESTSDGANGNVPCVGYDPRSKNIIVLKDIGDNSNNDDAWVYNMLTQSWTEGIDMITNGSVVRHTNFIITNDGFLTNKRNNDGTLLNYNHDMRTDNNSDASAQTITYQTKDLDFGLPSQTKKIFKVYVTYKGDADALAVYFGVDGGTIDKQFNSSNTPLSDTSALTVATLIPTTSSQATGINSLALKFTGSIGVDAADEFEINDISILYRARPVK